MPKKRIGIEAELVLDPSPKKLKKDQLEEKRLAREQRYAAYLEKKAKEASDKLKSRPPWRPSGRATANRITEKKIATASSRNNSRPPTANEARPVTRSMRKTQSDSNIRTKSLFDIGKNVKVSKESQCPIIPQSPVTSQPRKSVLPKPIYSENSTTEPEKESNTEPEPIKPKPTGVTPMMNRVSKISLDDDDELALKKWTKVYNESESKLKAYQIDIGNFATPTDEFWKLEVERVEGEVVLFLGPKSKHTQFGKMCLDPRNEKYKVEKEEDLQAFWDAMVLPSIKYFCERMDWLNKATKLEWPDDMKESKPKSEMGKSPARPRQNREITKTAEELEEEAKKKEEQRAKKENNRKAAEERRKEMRRMMAAKRKQAKLASSESSPALIQVSESCSTIPEEGGTASVLTEKQNTIASEEPNLIL